MTSLIPSLYNNTLQVPLQQTEGASSSYRIITISNVIRKCINIVPKEATASHSLTNCSNSEVLSRRSEATKRLWEDPHYRKTLSETTKRRWKDPQYRKTLSEIAKHRWKDPQCRKTLSEIAKRRWKDPQCRENHSNAIKRRWENPEYRKKILDSKKRRGKDPELIQLSRQRADEAIASVLAQTQQQKIKVEHQEDVLPKGDHELQMIGYSRVVHEITSYSSRSKRNLTSYLKSAFLLK